MKKPIRQAQGKHFYSHLIETSILSLELGELDLSKEERLHLFSLAQANIHTAVIDAILSQLKEDDKKFFLMYLAINDHSKIWEHLKKKIENVEEKIKKAAQEIKEELHKDIKESRKNK